MQFGCWSHETSWAEDVMEARACSAVCGQCKLGLSLTHSLCVWACMHISSVRVVPRVGRRLVLVGPHGWRVRHRSIGRYWASSSSLPCKPNQTKPTSPDSIRFDSKHACKKKNGRMDSIQMPMLLCYIATTPSVPIYINDPIIKILYRNIIIHKERIKLNKLVSGWRVDR